MKKIPTYRIFIDENEGALVYKNSIVTNPAHSKNHYAFAEVKKLSFEDVKQNIVGVAIAPDMKIYRNDPEMGEHFVIFKKEDIEQMAYIFSKHGYHNELEYEHDPNQPSKTASLYFSYIIDEAKGFPAPEAFKNEKDGTWLLGYHFEDKVEYEFARDKGGFSIEGTFLLEKMSNQFKTINMNKNEKKVSLWKKFSDNIAELLQEETTAVAFENVILEDGTEAKHEGVGSPLVLITADGEINAEDGSYTLSDKKIVSVVDGLIAEITEAEEEEEAIAEDLAEFANSVIEGFKAFKAENALLKARIEKLEKTPTEKPKQKFERTDDGLSAKTKQLIETYKKHNK